MYILVIIRRYIVSQVLESWMIRLEKDSSQMRQQTQLLEIGYKEQIKACFEILQRCTRKIGQRHSGGSSNQTLWGQLVDTVGPSHISYSKILLVSPKPVGPGGPTAIACIRQCNDRGYPTYTGGNRSKGQIGRWAYSKCLSGMYILIGIIY
jgi:hypothetical protein